MDIRTIMIAGLCLMTLMTGNTPVSYALSVPEEEAVATPLNVATCGNGIREATEQCDGSDMGSSTCADLGFTGGTAVCGASCEIQGCFFAKICGDKILQPDEECEDGNTVSGDGCSATCEKEPQVVSMVAYSSGSASGGGSTYPLQSSSVTTPEGDVPTPSQEQTVSISNAQNTPVSFSLDLSDISVPQSTTSISTVTPVVKTSSPQQTTSSDQTSSSETASSHEIDALTSKVHELEAQVQNNVEVIAAASLNMLLETHPEIYGAGDSEEILAMQNHLLENVIQPYISENSGILTAKLNQEGAGSGTYAMSSIIGMTDMIAKSHTDLREKRKNTLDLSFLAFGLISFYCILMFYHLKSSASSFQRILMKSPDHKG